MNDITYSTNTTGLLTTEVIELYASLGWGKETDYNEDLIRKAILNTSLIISARDINSRLVAIARILSDDVLHSHIAVHPLFRRQGKAHQLWNK